MILKIINSVLILFALYMGIKQGWAMFSGKAPMLEMFSKWGMEKNSVMILGAITIIGALLVLFPRTFIAGNFITAAGILLIAAFHSGDRDLRGFAIELPFLALSLVIIYLQHPLSKV